MPSQHELGTVMMAIFTDSNQQPAMCVCHQGLNVDWGQGRLLEEVTFEQKPEG